MQGVDALISFEGFALGLQEVVTVGLEMIVANPIAEAFVVSGGNALLALAMEGLH
jgi:hypothetical protein